MTKILFITSNAHKATEAKRILKASGVSISPLNLNIDEIRSDSCAEVARGAADEAFRKLKKPLFVEDAGLFIGALDGFPGAFSAWSFRKIGNAGILKLLAGVKDRRARFVSAIAYRDKNVSKVFIGECPGRIANKKRGPPGFGFDPIFVPSLRPSRPGQFGRAVQSVRASQNDLTFAQDPENKACVSHRRKALDKFAKWYLSYSKSHSKIRRLK